MKLTFDRKAGDASVYTFVDPRGQLHTIILTSAEVAMAGEMEALIERLHLICASQKRAAA